MPSTFCLGCFWRTRGRASVISLLLCLYLLVPATLLGQQSLTLRQAVDIALEKNPARKAALAEVRASQAGVREVRAVLLPSINFTESMTRSNDPVYVFGTRLRQQRFSAADFALNRLNTPAPVGDFSSRFSGQWRLFDSFANYRMIDRARAVHQAAQAQLSYRDQGLIARTVVEYLNVLTAQKRVALAEVALATAGSILESSTNRVDAGMTIEADKLSAQVLAANRRRDLIRARNDLALGRAQLSATLGVSLAGDSVLRDELKEREFTPAALGELEHQALANRADLKRMQQEQRAQELSVALARSAFGPTVDAFGTWQTNSPNVIWNGSNNWAAGVEVKIDLFRGGAKRAQLDRERANSERMAALRTSLEDAIRLDVQKAYYDLDSAQQQQLVLRASLQQAEESLRIVRNRYDAGLATVTDVLRVEEAAQRTRTSYWDAVAAVITSYAQLELATGALSPDSTVVMP